MKRKITKILGVVLTLALLSSLAIVVTPVSAIVAPTGPGENKWGGVDMPVLSPDTDVGSMAIAPDGTIFAALQIPGLSLGTSGGTSTATWSTTKKVSGSYSALLDFVDAQNYVDFVPAPGTTGAAFLASTPADSGFWYFLETTTPGPQLELKFTDPADSANFVDITFMLQTNASLDAWTQVDLDSTFGSVGTWDGSTFTPYADFAAAITGLGGSIDAYELTKVRVELYNDPAPARTCYVDDVTINGVLYDLEPAKVVKSINNGFTWTDTKLTGLTTTVADIVISPDYSADATLYIGCMNGSVYRMAAAGDASPVHLRSIVDSNGVTATAVYDLDVWNDGSNNWVLAGTDLDVLVLRDNPMFEGWRDQELVAPPSTCPAYEVAFSPNFDSSSLIWAVVDDGSGNFEVTSTVSPGQWGMTVDPVLLTNQASLPVAASIYVDMAFSDYYTSAQPVLYVGCTDTLTNDGNIWLIKGALVGSGLTEATPLLSTDDDIVSVKVSGEVILAGTYDSGVVYISTNGGDTFTGLDKQPTGEWLFNVYMSADVVWEGSDFDPETGVAFCSTSGAESAVSYTEFGGWSWNQCGLIDTTIDNVGDLAFAPEAGALMVTHADAGVDSLWRTADAAAASPLWERVQTDTGLGLDDAILVEWAHDGSCTMLYGRNGSDYKIYKSTDNAQTFASWRTLPVDVGQIADWVVYDGATVYMATGTSTYGFYGTSRLGPATKKLSGVTSISIALSPDFANDGTILIGDDAGDVYASVDVGDNWGIAAATGTSGNTYVAFDALDATTIYAATNAVDSSIQTGTVGTDGDIYHMANGIETPGLIVLLDDTSDAEATGAFNGLVVSPDNALYAIGSPTVAASQTVTFAAGTLTVTDGTTPIDLDLTGLTITRTSGIFVNGEAINFIGSSINWVSSSMAVGTVYLVGGTSSATGTIDVTVYNSSSDWVTASDCVVSLASATASVGVPTTGDAQLYRLLLGEPDSVWEYAPKADMVGLWLTSGSNTLWTINNTATTKVVYALEDMLSGQVTGLEASAVTETSAAISWAALDAAIGYEFSWGPGDGTFAFASMSLASGKLTGLSDNTEYDCWVRTTAPFHSRWSDITTFITLETIVVGKNLVPENGMQDAPLLPSFVWTEVSNAEEYEFELSTDPGFDTTVVKTTISAPDTAYTCTTELAYDTNHYWRVRAVSTDAKSGIDAVSDWCFSNFHTRTEEIPPVTIPPQVTPEVTVTMEAPDVTIPDINITVVPPDVTYEVPEVVTVTQPPPTTFVLPTDDAGTPVYIWVIVGIGAVLTIAVIVLIIRTRRVV